MSTSSKGTARRRVAVLGATGAVGQAFIRMLANHPWFELTEVAASERSAGKPYAEAAKWIGDDNMPAAVANMMVQPCDPRCVSADLVFSALDSTAAQDAEPAFARAGKMVLTNAKNYRMEPDVPLVIAEINPSHLSILDAQRKSRGWAAGGGIVANGNCSAIVATLPLAPIHQRFGIQKLVIVTMQAVSGAGYPGVPSLDILGNVIPYIADEEPKIEGEVRKFLGSVTGDTIASIPAKVSAHANRVPVEHGHTVCISIELEQKANAEQVQQAIADWRGDESARDLPSAPERPLIVTTDPDRPQPRRQVNAGGGMSVIVGRVRPDPVFDVKLVAMGHNVIRGAAGASVLNAELMMHRGLLGA